MELIDINKNDQAEGLVNRVYQYCKNREDMQVNVISVHHLVDDTDAADAVRSGKRQKSRNFATFCQQLGQVPADSGSLVTSFHASFAAKSSEHRGLSCAAYVSHRLRDIRMAIGKVCQLRLNSVMYNILVYKFHSVNFTVFALLCQLVHGHV
jgi:hypothetical protein